MAEHQILDGALAQHVAEYVRDVPDFPKPGILFKDIAPVLGNAPLFSAIVTHFVERYRAKKIDTVVAIESRGFLFGAPVAYELGVPLHMARKKGKLPYTTIEQEYALEYGTATVALHTDAIRRGERAVVIDDLLATGGTAAATAQLVEQLGGTIVECAFVIELGFLPGKQRLQKYNLFSILRYE